MGKKKRSNTIPGPLSRKELRYAVRVVKGEAEGWCIFEDVQQDPGVAKALRWHYENCNFDGTWHYSDQCPKVVEAEGKSEGSPEDRVEAAVLQVARRIVQDHEVQEERRKRDREYRKKKRKQGK